MIIISSIINKPKNKTKNNNKKGFNLDVKNEMSNTVCNIKKGVYLLCSLQSKCLKA